MKCPLCNAPTEVDRTCNEAGVVVRTRICFNMHRFKTSESAISEPKPKRGYRKFSFDIPLEKNE